MGLNIPLKGQIFGHKIQRRSPIRNFELVPIWSPIQNSSKKSTYKSIKKAPVKWGFSYREKSNCAKGRTRTDTGVIPHAPQACVSTNSTTSAKILLVIPIKIKGSLIFSRNYICSRNIRSIFCCLFY